jgi:hypothetical protein
VGAVRAEMVAAQEIPDCKVWVGLDGRRQDVSSIGSNQGGPDPEDVPVIPEDDPKDEPEPDTFVKDFVDPDDDDTFLGDLPNRT